MLIELKYRNCSLLYIHIPASLQGQCLTVTWLTAKELRPHRDMANPSPRVNSDELNENGGRQRLCNDGILVRVPLKDLKATRDKIFRFGKGLFLLASKKVWGRSYRKEDYTDAIC